MQLALTVRFTACTGDFQASLYVQWIPLLWRFYITILRHNERCSTLFKPEQQCKQQYMVAGAMEQILLTVNYKVHPY